MKILATIWLTLCALVSAESNAEPLTFGTESFPPFSMVKNGEATGPFAEIVQAVCARILVPCVITVLPWRRAMLMVEQGTLSGAFPLAGIPAREKVFYLGDPVLDTAYAVYTVKGSPFNYTQPKDLSDHIIGVYGPSGTSMTLDALLTGVPRVRLVSELDNLTVLKKLALGRYGEAGLGFVNRDVAQYLVAQGMASNVQPAGDAKYLQYYIGLSRKTVTAAQAQAFRRGFADLNKAGRIQSILEKYGLQPAVQR